MASGDPVAQIWPTPGPSGSFAPFQTRQGGSTPKELDGHWAFDDTTTEYKDFNIILRGYGAGGLTVRLYARCASATSGQQRWGASIRRMQQNVDDYDSAGSWTFQTTDISVANVAGEEVVASIALSAGAMDNLASGERGILRIERVGGQPSGAIASGDAQLVAVEAYET